ncbi:MAG: glutathione S-transferase family protein [Myxococcales bacterium]
MLEIHGKHDCPFAWRVRLVAREKGAPYEWVHFDVPSPDARAAQHNPERKSPLLWDAGFALVESLVTAQYIEESVDGRALLPRDPRERARMRLLLATLIPGLEVEPSHAKQREAAVKKVRQGQAELDRALSDGRRYLGGDEPLLPDLMLWPFLTLQERDGAGVPAELSRAAAYWERVKDAPSLTATRP